jgi:ribosomal protein S18 acetylase RimI-like enzyme
LNQIQKITSKDEELVNKFIQNLGSSAQSFRYFAKRDIAILNQHLVTYLYVENNKPLGYAHLDKEEDIIWLGIAVVEDAIGKGIGKKLMSQLIIFAEQNNIKTIKLSVDSNNTGAIALYKNFGFEIIETKKTFHFMSWQNS